MECGAKREAVMRAAMELVGERGFHGSPVAAIADRAEVAAGTIYRFFESKEALINEVHAALEGEVHAAIMAGYPAGRPVRERFLHVGRALVAHFLASPLNFRFLEQFHNSPFGVACRREKVFGTKRRNVIRELLEEGRGQGLVKDLPTPLLLALFFGPLAAICRDHILEFSTLDDRLTGRAVEACWDAIRREPGGGRAGGTRALAH